MNKKHVPVTDMTFGQLYDAVDKGGEYYFNGHPIRVTNYRLLITLSSTQKQIYKALKSGLITHFTDQLEVLSKEQSK